MGPKVWGFVCLLLVGVFFWTSEATTTIANRSHCGDGDESPSHRVNTTARLAALRKAMASISVGGKSIQAFFLDTRDAHGSEYPTNNDRRLMYITGFSGSWGRAVITQNKAAVWVDGRYYLEADRDLDCNWIMMKYGLSETPSVVEWIDSEMTSSGQSVGVDKTLIGSKSFEDMRKELIALPKKTELLGVPASDNPVDDTWTSGRPARPTKPINVLKMSFAGKRWQDKICDLRKELARKKTIAFVVTSLDETAWLFNLRGDDIPFNPFFLSYAIVEADRTRLYILDKENRLTATPTDKESNQTLAAHLASSNTGTCDGASMSVEVLDYNQTKLEADLTSLVKTGRVWISQAANYAISSAVSSNSLVEKSPIAGPKTIKNPVERVGMHNAYNRDSAALIKFLAFLEKEITDGKRWTELSAAEELESRRLKLTYNRGLSFESITGYGSNGAVIHYRATNDTDQVISTDSLFLLDSGGQFLDGTIDTTRTMHYGTPTAYQKESYTRVLGSAINLASLKWPAGLYGNQIDAITRFQFWQDGLDYRHGTGHGVGAYLSVHDGPTYIGMTARAAPYAVPLTAYQFLSDEPGYYEDGQFGIRLETVVMVNPYTPKYTNFGKDFYEFSYVCLVPFETKLIENSQLTRKQVEWLNDYNKNIRSTMLPLLSGDQLAIDWVNSRTEEIRLDVSGAGAIYPTVVIFIALIYTIFSALDS